MTDAEIEELLYVALTEGLKSAIADGLGRSWPEGVAEVLERTMEVVEKHATRRGLSMEELKRVIERWHSEDREP